MSGTSFAIIVKNKTRLELLNERFNTRSQAQFYIERQGGNFSDYILEHERFHDALATVQRKLAKVVKSKLVERAMLPNYIFADDNIVIVVGQDGLVANTAKYVNGLPIIAINPDVERYDGVLLPFDVHNFLPAAEKVLGGNYAVKTLCMAEAELNDGQRLLAFNDLFIGAASHVSARYQLSFGDQRENHSSSGIIVATPAGSTGWLSSVYNMSDGMQSFISRKKAKQHAPQLGAEELMFVVREPFRSRVTQTGITAGILNQYNTLRIESFMPANGVIFSDGVEADFLQFNSGAIASIGIAPEKAKLVTAGKGEAEGEKRKAEMGCCGSSFVS